MKQRALLLAFVLLALSLAACGTAPATAEATSIATVVADDTIIAEGRIEPIQYARIAFNTSGVVSEVLVKEGQAVTEGQPLLRLGNESDTHYATAQLELVNAQKAFDDLLRSRDKDLAQAGIDLKEAKEAYVKADDYLKYLNNNRYIPQTSYSAELVSTGNGWTYKYKSKDFKGPAPKDWIIEAENDLALKKAKMDEAQRAYDRLKEGPDAEQLPILEARLNAAKAGVAAFEVIAPFDGVAAELGAKAGSSINAGEIAVTVADFSNWVIKTKDVTEIDVVKLKEGQSVTVKFDALPGLKFNGDVLSIGENYSENQGDVVYEVTILLTDQDPAMRWGMTAVVEFAK